MSCNVDDIEDIKVKIDEKEDNYIDKLEVIAFSTTSSESCQPKNLITVIIKLIDEEEDTSYIENGNKLSFGDINEDKEGTYRYKNLYGCVIYGKKIKKSKIKMSDFLLHGAKWKKKFMNKNYKSYIDSVLTCIIKEKPINWKDFAKSQVIVREVDLLRYIRYLLPYLSKNADIDNICCD
jgi:hypothetical protein